MHATAFGRRGGSEEDGQTPSAFACARLKRSTCAGRRCRCCARGFVRGHLRIFAHGRGGKDATSSSRRGAAMKEPARATSHRGIQRFHGHPETQAGTTTDFAHLNFVGVPPPCVEFLRARDACRCHRQHGGRVQPLVKPYSKLRGCETGSSKNHRASRKLFLIRDPVQSHISPS